MRDYLNVEKQIRNTYKIGRSSQTKDFVDRMLKKYLTFDSKMNIHDIFSEINKFIDISDPDITLSNYHHAIQTAEGIRADGYPEWFQVVGLIHDIGKVMFKKGCDEDGTSINTQWGIVGDTFIVGCALPMSLVYSEFNNLNPDMNNSIYNSKYGIYKPGCGLDNVKCSWGHDEYLYQILKHNNINLPNEAFYIIRYHSLYAHHKENSYSHLMDDYDKKMIGWLKLFNKYDLYTKKDVDIITPKIETYYKNILDKYFVKELRF
jgi:inositol oxygenase